MKTITLTLEESERLQKIQKLQFFCAKTQTNTWPEYLAKLKEWTDDVTKAHSLPRSEPFTFHTTGNFN